MNKTVHNIHCEGSAEDKELYSWIKSILLNLLTQSEKTFSSFCHCCSQLRACQVFTDARIEYLIFLARCSKFDVLDCVPE